MSEEGISPQANAVLIDHIESVLDLEALLLLSADPAKQWSAADLARELRVDANFIQQVLTRFAAQGILAANPDGTYRYAPANPDIDAGIRDLAQAYQDRRVTVIGLIFSKPIDKLKTFADAFRIRKEKSDG